MLLRELYEADGKTAVLAFGRLNPPTVGHAKLVDKIKSVNGDHYLFLSQTQKPKTDPLDFATKVKFVKQFFPGINVGHQSVRTPIQALEMLQGLGYTDIVFIAGSDRVQGFEKLFNTYNGQPDKTGKVPFKFNSIKVVSAGERDPDADDVSGMSASKMRAAAAAGELETFAQGVPDKKLAQTMYDAVRRGMGVKDAEPVKEAQLNEAFPLLIPALATAVRIGAPMVGRLLSKQAAKQAAKTVANNTGKVASATGKAVIKNPGKAALAVGSYEVYDTVSDAMEWLKELDVTEDLIKPLAQAMVKYALPVAAVLAILYGGKKLYDYMQDQDTVEESDLSADDEDEFHRVLDKLVHKYFGHSSDEKKKNNE